MLLHASCHFEMFTTQPVTSMFMLRPKSGNGQFVVREEFQTQPYTAMTEYVDNYGNLCQRVIIPEGNFTLRSSVVAECPEHIDVDMNARFVPIEDLPDDVLQFLLPSRYCESDKIQQLAFQITDLDATGYAQVEGIRSWINANLLYEYGVTNSSSSALDVSIARRGVCRDFSHLGISLCRALSIPARMVVGYLHNLKPMDLHAWFEAFVGDRWYTFDATQVNPVGKRISMAYGRDAADVAFASHFGIVDLREMWVEVKEEGEFSL